MLQLKRVWQNFSVLLATWYRWGLTKNWLLHSSLEQESWFLLAPIPIGSLYVSYFPFIYILYNILFIHPGSRYY